MNMEGRNERPYLNFQKNYRITYTFPECSADNPLGDTSISSILLYCAYSIGSIFMRMKCIFIFSAVPHTEKNLIEQTYGGSYNGECERGGSQ